MTVDAWRAIGGMDPRFRGWGCEDWALAHAAEVVHGPLIRTPNPAVHLWHPHGQGGHPDLEAENSALLTRYTACTTPSEIHRLRREAPIGGHA
jgi:hypothetical protein